MLFYFMQTFGPRKYFTSGATDHAAVERRLRYTLSQTLVTPGATVEVQDVRQFLA